MSDKLKTPQPDPKGFEAAKKTFGLLASEAVAADADKIVLHDTETHLGSYEPGRVTNIVHATPKDGPEQIHATLYRDGTGYVANLFPDGTATLKVDATLPSGELRSGSSNHPALAQAVVNRALREL